MSLMKHLSLTLIIAAGFLLNHDAFAAMKVIATIPDIAWAVKEIGKDHVEVRPLLKGTENPHFADAVPEFIRLAAEADMICLAGLELEVGWLPKVIARSGNEKIHSSGKGYCDLGKKVKVLEQPSGTIDRSMGDVHPFGNPHFWLSPVSLAQASQAILETLLQVDAEHASDYTKNYEAFKARMEKLASKNKARLAPLLVKNKGPHFVEYHKEFSYLADLYGLKSLGSIEEKPGVPPSAGRIASVALNAKAEHLKFALAAEYNPKNVLTKFQEISGIPVLTVPTMVHSNGPIKDYVELQDYIVDSIAKALNPAGK